MPCHDLTSTACHAHTRFEATIVRPSRASIVLVATLSPYLSAPRKSPILATGRRRAAPPAGARAQGVQPKLH
eukprot:4712524-Prymnesium_polylepis.1